MLSNKIIYGTIFLLLLTVTASAQDEKKNGHISLQFNDNDTMHVVTATVTDSATAQPLNKVALTFYVQRTFALMQVGDGTTDSTGAATAEFPKDIRADGNGKLIFIAKVEDDDVINNAAVQMTIKPDFPYLQNKPLTRAMYARYAPWWLVITFTLVVGTVWLLFVYVVYLVYRIKKAATVKINS